MSKKSKHNNQKVVTAAKSSSHELLNKSLAEAISHYEKGVKKFIEGLFGEAIPEFTETINIINGFLPAHLNRGRAYKEIGESEKALEDYDKIIEMYPYATPVGLVYYNRSIIKNDLGNQPEAINDLKRAIELVPDFHESYELLGEIYSDIGEYVEAIECHKKLLTLNPENDEILLKIAILYGSLGETNKSIETFQKTISINPKNYLAHLLLGANLFKLNKNKASLNHFNRGIQLMMADSDFDYDSDADLASIAHGGRGRIYFKLSKYPEAIQDLTKAIKLNEDPNDLYTYYNYRGTAHFGNGQMEDALSDFNKCLSLNPTSGLAIHNIKMMNKILEDMPESVRKLKEKPNIVLKYRFQDEMDIEDKTIEIIYEEIEDKN